MMRERPSKTMNNGVRVTRSENASSSASLSGSSLAETAPAGAGPEATATRVDFCAFIAAFEVVDAVDDDDELLISTALGDEMAADADEVERV